MPRLGLSSILLALLALAGVTIGWAERGIADDFPAQPIKVIIPNPPGGPGDVIIRAFSEKASTKFPKPFVLEYRAGASTTIGSTAVAKAKADGYTLLGMPSATLAVSVLRKNLPFNLEADLKPVIGVGSVPLALIVRAKHKFKSMDEFAAAAKKGEFFFGSGGVGTVAHLTGLLLMEELKAKATHVPFQGNPEVMMAIVSDSIDFFFGAAADAVAFSKSPQVQVLAVTSDKRVAGLEQVPTMAEVGLPNINSKLWYAYMAPTGTPPERIKRLYDVLADVATDAGLQERLGTLGFVVEVRDSQALATMMANEAARWRRIIEANNITINN